MANANRQVDFARLKDRVSIEDVVDHYGWLSNLKRSGESFKACCPIHDGTNKTQFVVTPPKAWKCFGDCDRGGNQLDLVAFVEDVTLREAAIMIAEWFDIDDCWREPQKGKRSQTANRGKARRSAPKAARNAVL